MCISPPPPKRRVRSQWYGCEWTDNRASWNWNWLMQRVTINHIIKYMIHYTVYNCTIINHSAGECACVCGSLTRRIPKFEKKITLAAVWIIPAIFFARLCDSASCVGEQLSAGGSQFKQQVLALRRVRYCLYMDVYFCKTFAGDWTLTHITQSVIQNQPDRVVSLAVEGTNLLLHLLCKTGTGDTYRDRPNNWICSSDLVCVIIWRSNNCCRIAATSVATRSCCWDCFA